MEKIPDSIHVAEAAIPYKVVEDDSISPLKTSRVRKPRSRKEEVITIRVTPEQKYLLTEAARARWMNVSQFVLSELLPQAEEIVAAMPKIIVSKEEYDRLVQALDAPPKENEALRRLFAEPRPHGF